MARVGCRRLLALIRGLPADSATWRQDQPGWTQDHELLATVAETVDAWGRLMTFAAMRGPVKGPKLPPSLIDLRHPDRRTPENQSADPAKPAPAPRRQRDEHGRVPAQVNEAAVRRFMRRGG